MRVALPLLWLMVLVGRAEAEGEKTVAAHRLQILSVLQEKFKYSASSQGPPVQDNPGGQGLPEPLAMKPFVVSVSRDLVSKLEPKTPDRGFDLTKDFKLVSRDMGALHLDIGMMKYVPVVPEIGSPLPKVTLLNIRW